MPRRFCPILLTLSQIFLAGALPAGPRFINALGHHFEVGPPLFASFPDGNPFTNPFTTYVYTPHASATEPPPAASSQPDAVAHEEGSSTITFGDPHLSVQTFTVTSLNSSQIPTSTLENQSSLAPTGSIITTLETAGHPPVQPFPTSVPSVTSATIQPLNSTVSFGNATAPTSQSTLTETITVPLTTFETVVVTQTVTTIAIETTATITAVTVLNTTVTSGGTVIATSTAGTTVITTTGTAIIETTLSASSVITGTLSTTLTTDTQLPNLPTATASCLLTMGCYGQDLFEPIAIGQPPTNIPQQGGHPVPRLGITNITGPIETNKFYENFVLGNQDFPAFTFPYTLAWSKGSGNAQSWGMAISHVEQSQKAFGPPNTAIPNSPDSFYINPLGIQSMVLSAAEFGSNTILTTDSLLAFSANVHLSPGTGSTSVLTMPLVQGMAFITGQYINLQPNIQSSVFFRSVSAAGEPKPGIFKYRITLEDGKVWLLYALPSNGINPNFKLVSSTLLQGPANWYGDIQISKLPNDGLDFIYDDAAGTWPTAGHIGGHAQDAKAQYSLSWTKGGPFAQNSTLVMFALPHHLQSFAATSPKTVTNLTLATTTVGTATAVIADYWVLEEDELPTSLGFAPWRPAGSSESTTSLSAAAVAAIQQVAVTEASQNMSAQTNLNSMYYSGKALSKFATLVYTMHDLADQADLAKTALLELESCFEVFSNNQQQFPLLYDTDWRGIVSSASYVTGDDGVDFGNSYYNDHHFHYGYFLHAAAVIGYLDPTWLIKNKDYVNALARDVSNPSSLDQYFPVFRSFDWYHGHSWAKGLFASGDGKDEESSSEDAMFAYGLKMWGKTIGDASMEGRGNLMLSVLARSLHNYFLMTSDNVNQPAQFIGNKVTGILFENKADHTTYFGTDFSYIEGIHMIPVMPFSTLTRTQQFVAEEWTTYFANGATRDAANITGGWKGIVYANFANINPSAAYNFFTQDNFDMSWIDGGASRTWYIALSAMLGGSP
ncbi:uncharacterized protein PV06_08087 [Exophiala oligosperma]|uniref:glucan endo-1,3-beta-D-glucosidase n=1 Tax=Exophiala oligosperma TaxID=215243 RepID=A0A0D2AHB1_9EURO|nr:uncharacterized protein PV06_08087 [Exophiala oligosperma]KIW39476.1 hypothetical protein PV06_08087 [Exophiala oligosperma]